MPLIYRVSRPLVCMLGAAPATRGSLSESTAGRRLPFNDEMQIVPMTAAYAAFANHGFVPSPTLIRRVEDRDGEILYEAKASPTRAISDTTAFLMASMMADVVNAGTAARVRQLGFTLPAAGKTGTTNDFKDAWFVGFTPKIVAGVWVGFDEPRTILPNGFAADVAVPLWTSFMKTATKDDKPEWLATPPGIATATVCRLSGKLATEGCEDVEVVNPNGTIERRSMVYTEYFVRGTEPTAYCDLHPTRGIIGTLASILTGGSVKPVPPRIEDTGIPPTAGATGVAPAVAAAPPPPSPPPAKKRGFWARLFGGRKSDKDDSDTSDQSSK